MELKYRTVMQEITHQIFTTSIATFYSTVYKENTFDTHTVASM